MAMELATADERVVVVENPIGSTPAGLNAAIAATSAPVVARVDAHAVLGAGYLRRAVETLGRTGAANVGGVQRAVGATPFEDAVAAAMTSRFGTGDATFHYGGAEGPTDTVYLGVFDRAALDAAGHFDESLQRNQDYELNIRLRATGGTVWFDPQLEVRYRPRGTLAGLARQYFQYGRWKRVVLQRHPGSLRWRQAAPPVVSMAVVVGVVASPLTRRALLLPVGYLAAVGVAAIASGRPSWARIFRLLAIYPTMHVAWSAGLLVGAPRCSVGAPLLGSATAFPPETDR